jgi:hypothetical protein
LNPESALREIGASTGIYVVVNRYRKTSVTNMRRFDLKQAPANWDESELLMA